jgi:hypothetical protein
MLKRVIKVIKEIRVIQAEREIRAIVARCFMPLVPLKQAP